MFEESLIESTGAVRVQSRWPAVISIALQASLAVLLVTLPMLHPERMLPRAVAMNLAPPMLPVPQPPPQVMPRVHLLPTVDTSAPEAPTVESEPRIRDGAITSAADEPPALTSVNLSGDAGVSSPLPIGSGSAEHVGIHVVPAGPPANVPAGPTAISKGVATGLLLAPIQPVYPRIAQITHTEGTVMVEAVISKSGRVESVHATSGPPMLRLAAEDAVRAARYKPFLLNDQPTEVAATFEIHFLMHE